MPHATMDPRRHPGTREPHENVYYTLQPARAQPQHQAQHPMQHDNYGSLPSHGRHSFTDFPSSHNVGSTQMQPQGNYGTLPSQHSQLPSYSSGNSGPFVQMGSFNTLPMQGGSYGTLPSHHDMGSSQSLPLGHHQQQGQMAQNRELPAPSLTRHSMKILQVPILVVGEDNRDSLISKGSSSPSASPSSTISDPGSSSSYVPRSQPMHMGSQRPGQVQVQVESHMGTPPGSPMYGQGSFPIHQSGQHTGQGSFPTHQSGQHTGQGSFPTHQSGQHTGQGSFPTHQSGQHSGKGSFPTHQGGQHTSQGSFPTHQSGQHTSQGSFPTNQSVQHPKFPPATQPQGSSQHQNTAGKSKGFPQSDTMSQGGFPHSGPPSHGYVHAATLPHRSSSAIPTHLQQQRPSPSSSPGSTTSLPATLPHPNHQHHTQHMHSANQPLARPSPTPSPTPRQPTVQILPAQSHPAQTPAFHMHNQNPDSLSHNNNKYNTFPGTMSQMVENPKVMSQLVENPKSGLGGAPMMDISGKMWSMQEDMQRMQKQMEDSFRNMHVAQPSLGNPSSSFPDFPSIMPAQPFGGMQPPSYADLATHATPSPISMSTPSLVEPDFGRMMSSDMGIGTPIVQDTLDNKGGKKQLKLNLDMHEFAPGEVKVRSDKNKLEVTAHHEEKDPNRITCRVFKQQYHLPENTRMAKLQYDMTPEGELKVEGTVKPRHRVKWSADTLTK